MFRHVGHKHGANAELLRCPGAAMHVTPHVHNGGCSRQERLCITEKRRDLCFAFIDDVMHWVDELLQPFPDW